MVDFNNLYLPGDEQAAEFPTSITHFGFIYARGFEKLPNGTKLVTYRNTDYPELGTHRATVPTFKPNRKLYNAVMHDLAQSINHHLADFVQMVEEKHDRVELLPEEVRGDYFEKNPPEDGTLPKYLHHCSIVYQRDWKKMNGNMVLSYKCLNYPMLGKIEIGGIPEGKITRRMANRVMLECYNAISTYIANYVRYALEEARKNKTIKTTDVRF